ncbi:MAG TPA: hypothetical protein VL326_21395 [Kofleriaceae bacterium]|jgi:outer membrane lipoprotein-sorting protein|nr:hypothetical protein [Kofleriaceae bacterium]
MRSAAVYLFILAVGGVAAFCAQKRTVARGDALAAELMESNKLIKSIQCDDKVPIGIEGAKFGCKVSFKNGDVNDYKFKLDREGNIIATDHN